MHSRGRIGHDVFLPMSLPLLLLLLTLLKQLLLLSPACAQVVGPPLGPSTCGTVVYNPSQDSCCGGVLLVGIPYAACCGTVTFDADRQGCCSGQIVDRPVAADGSLRGPLACCGTAGYDPTVSSCCGTTVVQRSPVTACCGGKPYFFPEPIGPTPPGPPGPPRSWQICCGCILYNVTGYLGQPACCNDQPYDTATQLCCNGAVHSVVGKLSPLCCGTALVDETSSSSCCNGLPYRSGPFGPFCCRDGTLSSTVCI